MRQNIFENLINYMFPIRQHAEVSFDYPNYAELPKSISTKLSSEAVDAMQILLHERFSSKRNFKSRYKIILKKLGEDII